MAAEGKFTLSSEQEGRSAKASRAAHPPVAKRLSERLQPGPQSSEPPCENFSGKGLSPVKARHRTYRLSPWARSPTHF